MCCALVIVFVLGVAAAVHSVGTAVGAGTTRGVWGVEIDGATTSFLQSASLVRMRNAGINTIVVEPAKLTREQLANAAHAAANANLHLLELLPPPYAPTTPSIDAVRVTCLARDTAQRMCAAQAPSLAAAATLSRQGRLAAVRLANPVELTRFLRAPRRLAAAGSRTAIVALLPLTSQNSNLSSWSTAIDAASTTGSVDLVVDPSGGSKQSALSSYLKKLSHVSGKSGGSTTTTTTGSGIPESTSTATTTTTTTTTSAPNTPSTPSGGGSTTTTVTTTNAVTTTTPSGTGDTQAPSAPASLRVSSATASSVSLTWAASSDNIAVAGYDVSVGTKSTVTQSTSATVSGLACGTAYTVTVDAFDAAGNHSGGVSVTASTAACSDTQAPSVPGSLGVTASSQTSATVAWSASTDNIAVTGYTVLLDGAQAGTTTGTSYSFTGLTCGTSHTVSVDAYDAAGNHSARTSVAAATSACASGSTSTANVFVAPTGSDSGANCKRFATAQAFPATETSVCATLQKAYALAACGDTVQLAGGSYPDPDPTLSYNSTKDGCSTGSHVLFEPRAGDTITMGHIGIWGAQHLELTSEGGTWQAGSLYVLDSGGGSCSGQPTTDAVIDGVTGLHYAYLGCAGGPAITNVTVQYSDIGNNDGCKTEDLVQVRATDRLTLRGNYIHDLYQSSSCGAHSDPIQMFGNETETVIDGNTFARTFDGVIAKTDEGNISGLRIVNNSFGASMASNTPYQLQIANNGTSGSCTGGSGTVIENNSFASAQAVEIYCSDAHATVADNLFAQGARLDNGSGVCPSGAQATLVDYNVWQGTGSTCGTHAATGATPNWANAGASGKPDLHVGAGSTGIVDAGAPAGMSGDYASTDADGQPRPQGGATDPGAYEKG